MGTFKDVLAAFMIASHGSRSLLNAIWDMILTAPGDRKDKHIWKLTSNSRFSVPFFYRFLIDSGKLCRITLIILKCFCFQKISAFNWLVWDNKILTLDNLTVQGCNKLPIATCTLCHCAIETSNYLFIHCPIAIGTWAHFLRSLG